jgi:hypothetical protein
MPKDAEKPLREPQQQKSEGQRPQAKENGAKEGASESAIIELIQAQHEAMEAALAKRSHDSDIEAVVHEFAKAWIPHDDVEIDMLYPALLSSGGAFDDFDQSVVRHDIINLLLRDLLARPDQNSGRAKLELLAAEYGALHSMEQTLGDVSHRIEAAGKSSPDLIVAIKERIEDMKRRLERPGDNLGEAFNALAPRSLSIRSNRQQSRRENDMQRTSNFRERNEQGRFLPEDDRGRGYGREYRGRYQDEDRDERRARSRDDEDERYRSREDYAGGRGDGGWFGDPEGHREASRRGWQSERYGESGWYGDPQGHSDASRRGWPGGRHGESGWYGDADGHSQASRRGWDEREGGYRRGNGGEYRSRGQYDDERHARGDWLGDSEGYPQQASRRGWDERESGYRSRDDDDYRRRSRYDH